MKVEKQINRLKDELINNIINSSDCEILEEAKEDYGDSNCVIDNFKLILKKSKDNVDKRRLKKDGRL